MKYINAGLYVIKNKNVWHDWVKANKKYGNNFPSIEQDILNCIVNSEKYNTRYLDPVGSGISYGLCNAWGKHTHWDSWRESYLNNNELYIDNGFGIPLLTKVLHVAGGSSTGYPKQDFDRFFTGEVKEWLNKITNKDNKMEKQTIQLIKGTEMRPEHDKGMRDIIEKLKPGTVMVEVGCYYGESTLIWAGSDKVDKIFAVDRWADFYDKNDLASERGNMKQVEDMFDANIKGNKKIQKIKGNSIDISKLLYKEAFDFIYIDASHKYEDVVNDIKAWLTCLKPGGILGGHDINNDGVRRAVLDTIGEPDFAFDDFSWIKTIN
jgi:SAM-dependent methyltransferase